MIAKRIRHIDPTTSYDMLFPAAQGTVYTVKKNASVANTVDFIPKVVFATLDHTRRIADLLRDDDLRTTCKNIWHFVYRHINYKKDEDGYEQIRSPRRAWHDRFSGVDCDCYSVFISSILSNLGIPHALRITKYSQDHFQHIYPIVPLAGSGQITIDCVTDRFDHEVPFTEKKDFPMDLQYLNGFDAIDEPINGNEENLTGGGQEELGRVLRRHMKNGRRNMVKPPFFMRRHDRRGKHRRLAPPEEAPVTETESTAAETLPASAPVPTPATENLLPAPPAVNLITPQPQPAPVPTTEAPAYEAPQPQPESDTESSEQPMGSFLSKALHVVNKFNPLTVVLRNGLLVAMKLNLLNVAKNLRWSYLTAQQAAQKNIIPAKFNKLVKIRQKLESIFKTAGGNPANLKKAILNGKGNKDKAVHGFEGLGEIDFGMIDAMEGMDENTPLVQLLGPEIYYDENPKTFAGLEGFDTSGEPLGAVTVAAAMAAVATLAKLIGAVGNIFGKGKDKQETVTEDESAAAATAEAQAAPAPAAATAAPSAAPAPAAEPEPAPAAPQSSVPKAMVTQSASVVAPILPDDGSANATSQPAQVEPDAAPPASTAVVQRTATSLAPPELPVPAAPVAPPAKESFFKKNQKWFWIAGGGLALAAVVYFATRKHHPEQKPVSGLPRNKKRKYSSRQLNGTIEEIELL